MEHAAYARKYRPKNFDELVGQQHIATTLKNSINQGNIASAYLFSGPRGIGKTSTARVLAKALNCSTGPTPKPCGKCDNCKEIRDGRSLDVLEIDGASNRGIDEIRTLRENVKFAPSNSKFKIYIIDEVHMLTTEAFNALLKTLEEPPQHVKFIFATTEPHKVLPTILSRCQRFDFRRISAESIVETLKKLSSSEKIKVEVEALYAISRSADGSLRDAEVVLDQLNSFGGGNITLQDVTEVLGLVSNDITASIIENLNVSSRAKNLELLEKLAQEGKDAAQIVSSMIDYFRNMMLIKCGCEKLVALPKEDKEKVNAQSEKASLESILYSLSVLSQTAEKIKRQGLGKLLLEMALVKLSQKDTLLPTAKVMDTLKEIEEKLQKLSAGNVVSKHSFPKAQGVAQPRPSYGQTPQEKPMPVPEKVQAPIPPPKFPEQKPQALKSGTAQAVATELKQETIEKFWPHIIKAVQQQKISLGLFLAEGQLMSVKGNKIKVGFLAEYELHRDSLTENANKKLVEEIAAELIGQPIIFNFVHSNDLPKVERPQLEEIIEEESPIANAAAGDPETEDNLNDFIQSTMDFFNGSIVQSDE